MKKATTLLGIFSVVFIFLFHSSARAQDEPKLKFSVQTGIPLPLYSDYHQNFLGPMQSFAYNLGAGIHYDAASWLTPGLEFKYYHFGYEEDTFSFSESIDNITHLQAVNLTQALSITLSTDFYLATERANAVPFLLLNLGAARITEKLNYRLIDQSGNTATITQAYHNWGPVISIGGGFEFPITPTLDLEVNTRFVAWFNDGVSPLRFLPINATLKF